MEIGELRLREIEDFAAQFKICPKCDSLQGFWVGTKSDKAYVQCKVCGTSFEIFEVHAVSVKS
ncbi:MAG: hypothetical protein QXM86_03850 [Candidatus Bathyarchaeia archaeon]